jgi:pterin-4a-carbinolamine dehydratase
VSAPTSALPKGWEQHPLELVRELRFRDFRAGWSFVDSIADRAVDFGRRPDVHLQSHPTTVLRLVVHNVNHVGLTEAEFRLAAKVELAIEQHHRSGRLPQLVFEDGVLRARV